MTRSVLLKYIIIFTSCLLTAVCVWVTVCVSMSGDSLSALLYELLCMLQHRQSQCQKREALIHGDMYGTVLSHSRCIYN